ncbi:uncharacterized protein Z518_04275 [Rhinocladiella mackenziei CBS 650.93]|uniref:Uncharacterized protein n=1 Tax=Rhinocladiella mackenziei CBS 650.93 TaxID=1442369 RepID=A0A0D2JB13_9EURO|nr:uncharacterized protein Z518_04275 [Rhinocladiella mackenziei CBS 650.93]KIX06300.1 hypothetical protein Z518_04275 [Rhinocladiella mackenziei CBS 650.93]
MSTPPTAASATQPTSSNRPPVTLGQATHLDPGAYVRSTHAITLGDHILVHPRAQLVAIHGPLSISDKCIISEKCVIGGPAPNPSTAADPGAKLSAQGGGDDEGDEANDERDPVKTTIHANVYIHPSSHINAGATIKNAVVIESHVTVLPGVTIGAHAKICAGVTVDRDVEDWTVQYGNGEMKRKRRKMATIANEEDRDADAELVETMRLKAMDKEREGTVAIFKMAARMASMAKKK